MTDNQAELIWIHGRATGYQSYDPDGGVREYNGEGEHWWERVDPAEIGVDLPASLVKDEWLEAFQGGWEEASSDHFKNEARWTD